MQAAVWVATSKNKQTIWHTWQRLGEAASFMFEAKSKRKPKLLSF